MLTNTDAHTHLSLSPSLPPFVPPSLSLSPSRANACLYRLAELNPYVTVTTSTKPLNTQSDLSILGSYQVYTQSIVL